jgi:AcrR family transcriptional regulator
MKTTRTKTPAVRRQQILQAAKNILVEQGYSEVLLDEVAKKAGVAKGTLYLYFKDKAHLYAAVMENLMDASEIRLRAVTLSPNLPPLQKLKRTFEDMLEFFDENKDFIMQCGHAKSQLVGKRAEQDLRDRWERHLNFLSEIPEACIKSGDLRAHDPITAARLMVALVRMFMIRRITKGGKPLRSHTAEVMDLFLHGLGRHES